MSLGLAEAEAEHTGAMIALIPSIEDAARLAVDGGEPADQLHLTLAYLGDAADISAATRQDVIDSVSAAVNGMPAVDAAAFGVSAFNPNGDEPCLVYAIGGDLVDAAHTLVSEAVWSASPKQHAPWHCHLTAIFTGDLARLGDLVERLGPVRFDRMRIAFGGQALDIPLIEDEPDEDDGDEPDESLWLAEADGDRDRYQLRKFFTKDPRGLKRWAVGHKHPWTALFKILRKKLSVERAKRVTSAWYIRVFGGPPSRRGKVKESARLIEAGADHPDSCETADLTSVCHCGCNGTRHGDRRARTRLGNVQADRADREGRDVRLAAMSDDELAAMFARYSREMNWDRFGEIDAEMTRREQNAQWPDPTAAEDHWNTGGEPSEQDRQIDALVARGYDFVEAYAEVHGQDPEQLRRQQATSAVAADRQAGESVDQAVRRGYDQFVHEQWLRAEADTRGHLLNAEAQAAGIQPVDLFSGPTNRARKWASEDLQRWWADNGRMTFTQYRAQVLGRESDRRAAELTAVGANGRDFI